MQLGVVVGHAAEQRDAADGVEIARRLAGGEPVRHLDDGALGIAVEQEVRLGVGQDRAAHLVGPVVVMRDAAQRRLDAAEHDRHVLERLAAALRVDDGAAVRPLAAFAARRVGVVVAQPAVRRVAVDHRVHVAAGDAEEQARLAQRLERLGRLPVRLRDDADPEALRLEQPADDRHAEARMVDIGVAGHQHDVAGVPAERVISARLIGRNGAPWPAARGGRETNGRSAAVTVSIAQPIRRLRDEFQAIEYRRVRAEAARP